MKKMAKHSMEFVALLLGFLLVATPARAQEEVIYYHTDAIGSVRAITDNSGAVVGRWDYLPFGELWPADPPHPANPRQFAGKERDSVTELDYFGARYLRAVSARFISVDPVINLDAALPDPQRWNRYAYAKNNPFVYIDPDGRDIVPPAVFQQDAFRQLAGENLRGFLKSLFNVVQSVNLPGHMTPEAELRHFAQPDSHEEGRRMQVFDLLLSVSPLLSRTTSRGASSWTRTSDLEATHGTTMSNRAFAKLKADIAKNGILEPISYVTNNGRKYVVDGHHRLRAAQDLGMLTVPTREVSLPYAGYKTAADLRYEYK